MADPVSVAAIAKASQAALADSGAEVEAFTSQITGAPRKELGAWFSDHIRLRRMRSQLKILKKAQEYAEEAGFEPGVVNMNLLVPLLEAGSLEEDEGMADRWAALLANAAGRDAGVYEVPPSFPDVLRQLSPKEAALLDAVYEAAIQHPPEEWSHRGALAAAAQQFVDMNDEEFAVGKQNLIRLGLCRDPANGFEFTDQDFKYQIVDSHLICLTRYGAAFVRACRTPSPNSS